MKMSISKQHLKSMLIYTIPVAVTVIFVIGVLIVANERGDDPIESIFLTKKWDINHYKTITTEGYIVHDCTGKRGYAKGEICGNPGWWPGWPLLAKPFYWIIADIDLTYAILTCFFTLSTFVLLFHITLTKWGKSAACFSALSLACFPGSFYLLTGFPYSFLLTLLLLFILLQRFRYVAFLLAFAASATYPSVSLFALYPATIMIQKIIAKDTDVNSCIDIAVFRIFPFALGPLAFFSYFWITQDDFWLHLQFQSQPRYARNWSWPWDAVWTHLKTRRGAHPEVLSFLSAIFILAAFGTKRLGAGLWAVTGALLVLSPATGTLLSVFRHYLLIFPLHFLIGISRQPMTIKILFLLVMAALNRQYILMFVYGRLI